MKAGDLCFILCINASLNLGQKGLYFGYGGGFGPRAEASFGVGGGYGSLSPTGNVSAECAVFIPFGISAGANLTPAGGYATIGGGAGGGCSLNFGNYNKLL